MTSPNNPEPDQLSEVIKVGQDCADHWLVQDSWGKLEGRFASRAAAIGFAQRAARVSRRNDRHGGNPADPDDFLRSGSAFGDNAPLSRGCLMRPLPSRSSTLRAQQ